MFDWNSWLGSSETRKALKILRETTEELRDLITDGSHIQEKQTGKIALDYTYSLGQLDGMRTIISMIEDIKDIVNETEENRGN